MPKQSTVYFAFCSVLGLQWSALAFGESENFEKQVRPFFTKHCAECHAAEKPKGDFRIDRLDRIDDLNLEMTVEGEAKWLKVLNRIESGEMPPKSSPRPSQSEIQAVASWLREHLASNGSKQGRVALRRLNRTEYENTIQDLLGVQVELKEMLPPDTSANGFDNSAQALHISSFLLERYLEAADVALNLAIANCPQPPLVKKRLSCKDERHVKATTERVFRHLDDALVFFSSSAWQAVTVGQFYPPDRGRYRFKISARAIQSNGKPVSYRVEAGAMLMGTKNRLIGYFDAPPETSSITEFVEHLEARNTIRILPFGLESAQAVNKIGADQYEGPGLAVEWIEVEGPLYDHWPPESHRHIFGDLPQQPMPARDVRDRVEVISSSPHEDATRILRDFARRAFRRQVTDDDVEPLVALFEDKLAEGYSFEQALRVGLKGALVSPEFLFLKERPGKLDSFAVANRLSYFLWSTMPDDELLHLAEKSSAEQATESGLLNPAVLRGQVERMLGHSKAKAFTQNFVGQWLGLRDIDFTEPDRRLYPEFDDMLKAAMVQEAYLFFEEVLKEDLSVANFVQSDFSMLNERLAKHYGIPGVAGHSFRKVSLPAESHRGGVLTMGAVLKVTANGTTTSPVVRGAWVLDRILGTPPQPPPAGVPAVEPDIRGATTIREQLAKHREIESCAACHSEIDPPGFALESFDVIGGWRENYRSVGRGEPVVIEGKRMHYAKGPPVNPSDQLPDGRAFANIDEFKSLVLENKEQLVRSMATKLITYGTGRAPEVSDRPQVDAIVAEARGKKDGLRSLIHAIVQSPLFLNK